MIKIKVGDTLECEGKTAKVVEILDDDSFPYLMDDGLRYSSSTSIKINKD